MLATDSIIMYYKTEVLIIIILGIDIDISSSSKLLLGNTKYYDTCNYLIV